MLIFQLDCSKCCKAKENLKNTSNYYKNMIVTDKDIVYYMSELNAVHSFREGNERAIIKFIR